MQYPKRIRVAISHGDANGINYELLLKMFIEANILELFTPVIYGSVKVAAYWRKTLGIENSLPWQQIQKASEARDGQVNVIDVVGDSLKVEPGQISASAGMAAFKALEMAAYDVDKGYCHVLVTAPINKAAMPQDVFPFKGHTDYLQSRFARRIGQSLMILVAGDTRVALATTHVAVKDISALLSAELIAKKLDMLQDSLLRDFSVAGARMAVLALNPHAGDKGLMGDEEENIIVPAIKEAATKGQMAFGPFAADGFWGSDMPDRYHGILAMYHDQGLAPFKALYMNEGVNFTAGLSIVRTSPDHGTGFDIAGQGVANANSMRQAIYTAIDIWRCREAYLEATKNPLRRTFFERGNDNEKIEPLEGEEED